MTPDDEPEDLIDLPGDIPSYGLQRPQTADGKLTTPKEPHAKESARLLMISRRIGMRLAYALRPGKKACAACGMVPLIDMPDAQALEAYKEYGRIVLGLLKEQRERVALMLKYKLRPDMSEKQIHAKIREIVLIEVETMPDDDLAEALERRRAARAGV